MIKTGLPEHPDQTFTMVAPAADAAPLSALPPPPLWTVTADADATRAVSEPPTARATAGAAATDTGAAYRLLRQIGRGAMGEVWEAEQTSLGRLIAVKRLRRENGPHATPDALRIADFRSESEIAASLEHPNILPVYDLGRDASGALLLAMKRIHGTPWNEQLQRDFDAMPVDAFLAHHIPTLMTVTQAVAFAHSRDVIHRDLKPSQVLVGAFGEVLLTDWGLALRMKAPQSGERRGGFAHAPTPDTATNPAGTPSMMAPEQTEDHGGNLGPWTDVYLLGGILYYLLTGSYPHASDSSEAAFAEARTGRVQPPGARTPGRLVPPELEQLCLKAMEPAKADRLPSASAFLKGLEDYQRGTLRKEQSAELVARVAQRFTAGEPDYAGYTAAIASLDEARRLWPDNEAISPLRQRALHDSARLALRQGDLSFARLQCEAMADGEQASTLRGEIAQRQRQVDRRRSQLRLATAAVFALLVVLAAGGLVFSQRMNAANKAIAQHARETEQALKIAKTRSNGAFELVTFVLDDLKKAMDAELTPEHGVTTEERNYLSDAIAGKVASPIVAYFEKADPATWPTDMQVQRTTQITAVAHRLRTMGRYGEAEALLKPAVALRATLPDPHAEDAGQLLNELAVTYQETGRYDQAIPVTRKLIDYETARSGADAPEVGELLHNLGSIYWRLGKLDEAEKLVRRAVANFRAHPEYELRDRLPRTLSTLGAIINEEGRTSEAETVLREALKIAERDLGPDNIALGSILNNLAVVLKKEKQFDESNKLLQRAIKIVAAKLGPENPAIAALSLNVGVNYRDAGRDAEAEPWLRRSVEIRRKKMAGSRVAADSMHELGRLYYDTRRYKAAEPLLRKSLDIYTESLGAGHYKVGMTAYDLGLLMQARHRPASARPLLQRAVDVLRKHDPDDPFVGKAQRALDAANGRLGRAAAKPGPAAVTAPD
ncbi:MAG TPA: serine/threonine-protein kinase [Rhodanobacteraceae bacterium]|nr:serine/threonine-protein kinase [Rhodanobacteraceae bacterium]